jgi:hypothetical protein
MSICNGTAEIEQKLDEQNLAATHGVWRKLFVGMALLRPTIPQRHATRVFTTTSLLTYSNL